MDWIELNPGSFFPEAFLVRVGRLPRIKEQWETLQDNTPSPMLAIQPVFPETSFLENMMGDLMWVFIKCKSVSRCFFLVSFVSISKKMCFLGTRKKVSEPWTTPPNRKAKPMLPEVAGCVIFSGLAWGGKNVLNHGEVVLTKNQLSTPFMWKKNKWKPMLKS